MLDLIFFAALAIFVLFKLFNSLGKIDSSVETRSRKHKFYQPNEAAKEENLEAGKFDISIASAFEASLPAEVREVFDRVREHYPKFNAEQFLKGAKGAFTAIIEAFNKSDVDTLKKLLSAEVLAVFKAEIAQRKATGYKYHSIILAVKECEIIKASFDGQEVIISVKILSEQINAVLDAQGNLLEGNQDDAEIIEDNWTFSKKIKSTSSVWLLAQTSA